MLLMISIPTVSAQELKDGWPKFIRQIQQAARSKPFEPLPRDLSVRCAVLFDFLKGQEPTDQMFEVMANFPFDGTASKKELQKQLFG